MQELTEDSHKKLERVKNIISNYKQLHISGELEEQWIDSYLHTSCFRDIPFEDLKKVFDACDKHKLQKLHKLPSRDSCQNLNPFTLFRGCVGNTFQPGMSWTTCLYQAIKYPKCARMNCHYEDAENQPCSVWAALVEKDEIYCYLDHYEPEFITCPKKYWKIDIPQKEFEYNNIGIQTKIEE